MNRIAKPIAIFAALLWVLPSALAEVKAFKVLNNGGSKVQFTSDAVLETITGLTSDVSGEISLDPANPAGARGKIEVALASLRTGIDLRDEHLRSENWLDIGHHPKAVFEITRIEIAGRGSAAPAAPAKQTKGQPRPAAPASAPLTPGQDVSAKVWGRFTIRGVTRNVTANARVRYMPASAEMRGVMVNGDTTIIRANFDLKLSDFGITSNNPVTRTVLGLKVSNDIRVDVTLRATNS